MSYIENKEERSKANFIIVGHGTKRERESIIRKRTRDTMHDYKNINVIIK